MLNVQNVAILTHQAYCLASYQVYADDSTTEQRVHMLRTCHALCERHSYVRLRAGERSFTILRIGMLYVVVVSSEELAYVETVPILIVVNAIHEAAADYLTSLDEIIYELTAEAENNNNGAPEEFAPNTPLVEAQPLFSRIQHYWDHKSFFTRYRKPIFQALRLTAHEPFTKSSVYIMQDDNKQVEIYMAPPQKLSTQIGSLVFEAADEQERSQVLVAVNELLTE